MESGREYTERNFKEFEFECMWNVRPDGESAAEMEKTGNTGKCWHCDGIVLRKLQLCERFLALIAY